MRENEKGEIIITRNKAVELFLLLSNARVKMTGKSKTLANKYWQELEKILLKEYIKKWEVKDRYY